MKCFCLLVVGTLAVVVPVRAEESTEIPASVLKQFKYFSGKWVMEGTTSDGQPAEATLSCSLPPGKHVLLFNATWSEPEIKSVGSGLFGWDLADNKVHTSEFWDNGVYHHRHYTVKSDKVWEGDEFAGITDGGQRLRAKFKIEFAGPNQFTMESWDRVVDGQPEAGRMTLTFTRK